MRILAFVVALTATSFAQAPAASLPAPVKSAFEKAYPGAAIAAATQEREGNRTVFRVDSLHGGKRRVVLYDASGATIQVGEQVEEKDLPAPVAAAIRSHRRAIYVSGLKVTRGGNVEYRITVRGSRRTAMVAKPDGTVVSFQ
jgi:hypothetical protein